MGGMLGPIVCGLLGELWGWSWGFGAAGVGMLAGLVMFVWLKPWLLGKGEPPAPQILRAPTATGLSQEWTIYLGAALGVAAIWLVIRYAELLGYALLGFSALSVVYILWRTVGTLGKVDRDRMFAALFLIALNPLFWGLFEQTGSSLNIFTDRNVDRNMLGWDVPASLFQSVNSVFIILLAPLFAVLWTFLDKRRLEPSSPAKFGIGLVLCGAGFLVLVAGAAMAGENLTPVIFVFLIYLLHTMAELCFSPVGLSAMTRLSVSSMVGLVMGTWFLAMAAGHFIAGLIARATGSGEAGNVTQVLDVYSRIGWFSIVVGGLVLLVSPYIKRLMHLDLIGTEDKA
jgi:POT family proton-dependent oligopeptide transporter